MRSLFSGRAALCALALSASISPAALAQSQEAATGPSQQGDVAITIYNDDIALVQDVRQLNIGNGDVRLEFPDVSAQIRPETLSFNAADTAILEQNFDFDLLTPSKLMEKAVGEMITIIRTNPATGVETRQRAKVLSVNNGVVLQIGNQIEVMRDDDLPVRAVFDKIPDNLRAKPTLSVRLDSQRAGRREASIRYLTSGLSWKADYVALFNEEQGRVDVQGWVTLGNNSGTTYHNANTLLVAGSPNMGNQNQGYHPRAPRDAAMVRAGTETPDREALGDFYLYPVGRTTIADQQIKQVSFLDVQGVPAQKGYRFRSNGFSSYDEAQSADSVVSFSTSKSGGLGDALPAGTLRFYQNDARGAAQFIGESSIDHTPMGSRMALTTGQAFDVKVKPVVVSRTRLSNNKWRTQMKYELSNARDQAVTIALQQYGLDWYWSDTRIEEESQPSERLNSNAAEWQVQVPANGNASLTATFITRY